MPADTREQFLDMAETLFAERGFYGVSIANIADELGLTKQALLHYFGNKEKLYGEVLRRISEHYEAEQADMLPGASDPTSQLRCFFLRMAHDAFRDSTRTRLLMRELLDNQARAATAETWYLRNFLKTLVDTLRRLPQWANATRAEALAPLYQLLGAINYFAISEPTLRAIFSDRHHNELARRFPAQLETTIDAVLSTR